MKKKPWLGKDKRQASPRKEKPEGKPEYKPSKKEGKPAYKSPRTEGKSAFKSTTPKPFSTRTVKGKGKGKGKTAPVPAPKVSEAADMRLNKYLAHGGIASRRKADEIIAAGGVTVNGNVVLEMGYRVQPDDIVKYQGKVIKPVGNMVYILLNKPKDYITTTSDEKERRTVMELVSKATNERIYPVGRLDRQTTGLLLMTNDGELAQKLSHPSHRFSKIYHATLDKPLQPNDMEAIASGLMLEDGKAEIDVIDYADPHDKKQVGVELHIGKNRIVRRIFEHLGYDVVKLDRVYYGGLTKKDLPRGRWRFLEEKEVIMLKHFT